MSMSTHVVLLRSPDDPHYKNMLGILRAYEKAKMNPPQEIYDYFGGELNPDYPLEIEFEPTPWQDDFSRQGFEIDLDDLPEGVKTIRFYNSW